jgi:predicted CoA-substrate-specific enzyme activase
MFFSGVDVGSLTSKAVIMKDNRIVKSVIIKSKARPWESADEVMGMALDQAGLTMKDIKNCVGTGYGRDKISFIDEAVSEIACHGKGARWLVPSVRTVIDIGGQDCKALRLDAKGDMMKFITNDKCASGTGRFLEVMAKVMNLNLDELGEMSAKSKQPITFASACTVWAQADVIQQLNDKVPIEDIAAGVNNAMASRMAILANSIGLENDVCMTGGVAKNNGVVNALEKNLGIRIKRIRREDPQIAGAIGAALFAMEKAAGGVI